MSSPSINASSFEQAARQGARPLRVLVVDPSPATGRLVRRCAPTEATLHVRRVETLAAAQRHMLSRPVDLAIVESELPDGSGLALHEALNRRYRRVDKIVVSARPTLEGAMQAMRAGAVDFLPKPIDSAALCERLRAVVAARVHQREQIQRVRRLRRACRKLDQTRQEVTQQVDVLCEDLVGAYQELADQMEHTVSQREFDAVIRDELDLEPLLRKTLSFLVDKTGPTNAAVFLPTLTPDEYSVGAYINYDCAKGGAELLLTHLADVLAPCVAEREQPLHLTDDAAIRHWLGDAAAHLADCEVLAFGCRAEGEPLAAVVLFRQRREPFDGTHVQVGGAIAQQLGQRLVKLIRIHHRAMPDDAFSCDEPE